MKFDIDPLKRYVIKSYPPGSPLREIILLEEGGEDHPEAFLAKARIWLRLAELEKHIHYNIKREYEHLYK